MLKRQRINICRSLRCWGDRILAEKQAKEELASANQRIRSYALKAEENGSLQERNRDNGCGFIPSNNLTGFGLQGMRERVISLQGKFEIISTPASDPDRLYPSGCQIVAIIPLN